jgi:aminoglycoside N3'-acetyltransferase
MVGEQYWKRWPNFALHKLLHERPRRVKRVEPERFASVFERYADDVVFVHAGLSDVNAALPGNPYETVLDVLERNFDSILAPGFTDYFRKSGVYAKEHSRPMYGAFNSLFLADANYRTDDACKSILVRGDYRFEGRNHHDTFSSDGCFAQLRDDDVLLVSIGTPWLMCSFLHYLESKHDVPYVYEDVYEGTLIDGDESRQIEQTCQYWDGFWRFNKLKLHRHWRERGVVDEYDLNGLGVFVASIADIEAATSPEIRSDPYYLVT